MILWLYETAQGDGHGGSLFKNETYWGKLMQKRIAKAGGEFPQSIPCKVIDG